MQITSPFGYQEITPLMQDQRVKAMPGDALPDFAVHANSLPISISEVPEACHDYPIAFVPQQDGKTFVMVAIVGIMEKENLFADGAIWREGAYVPAYVRRYPFCMTRVTLQGVQQSQRLVCVEKNHIAEDGVAFFDGKGQATPQWRQFLEFLNQYEVDLEHTLAFCSILRDFKLLEPMSMQATVSGQNMTLNGMYRVNLKRMETLNSSEIKTLYKNGAMAGIYHHMSSLNRFARLLELKARRLAAAPIQADTSEAPANEALNQT